MWLDYYVCPALSRAYAIALRSLSVWLYRAALSSQYYSNLSSTKRHRDLPLPPDAYLRSKVGLDRGAFWPVAELLGTPPI
jgi:hypothetical protein